jgi:hypothetical protein
MVTELVLLRHKNITCSNKCRQDNCRPEGQKQLSHIAFVLGQQVFGCLKILPQLHSIQDFGKNFNFSSHEFGFPDNSSILNVNNFYFYGFLQLLLPVSVDLKNGSEVDCGS